MARNKYTKKLQVFMRDEQLEAMDTLVERGGFRSRADLIDNALTLMEWSLGKVGEGYSIAAVDDGGDFYERMTMPAFIRIGASISRNSQPQEEPVALED